MGIRMKNQNTRLIDDSGSSIGNKINTDDETRPVKWIQEGKNAWRIVYAD